MKISNITKQVELYSAKNNATNKTTNINNLSSTKVRKNNTDKIEINFTSTTNCSASTEYQNKLSDLKTRISEGTYSVNSKEVAKKIVESYKRGI